MTRKEEYESVIVSKYKETKKALELLSDSELKLAIFSKCNTSIQLILLHGVDDELLTPSDFSYLGLKANTLLDELLLYFKEEIEKTGGLFI